MLFKLLVINRNGMPIFEYPFEGEKNQFEGINFESVLMSGLLTAINTYSLEVTGQIIGDMKFGSMQSTFSRDGFNNLYVVIAGGDIPADILKQIHIEIKALFLNSVDRINLEINPDEVNSIETNFDKNQVDSIFFPFYNLWVKKLKSMK